MKKKILLTILLVVLVAGVSVNIYATSFLGDVIQQGTDFGNAGWSTDLGDELEWFLKYDIVPIVSLFGNLVFAAVTVILGAKYIWSGAEGRSQVMESLPAFLIAVVFFYLGESIVTWLTGASSTIASANSWDTISGKIIGTINTVVKYAAFGGILYMGLRYMFASAEGKSQIKTNMGGAILGIIFVFMASNVVDFIIDIGESVL